MLAPWRRLAVAGAIAALAAAVLPAPAAGASVGSQGDAPACPVKALKHWQSVCGNSTGHIFSAVNRHDQIADKPLTPHAVAHIVKRIVELTGRDPDLYSGHSLRSGYVTAGTLAGIPSYQLMQQTGHKSEATLQKYVRIGKRRQIPSLL